MNYTQLITDAQEHQKGKVCTICKEHKPLSEFYKNTSTSSGLDYRCKSCVKEYNDNLCPFKRWFITKKARSKEFTIEPEDIPGVKIREVITESFLKWGKGCNNNGSSFVRKYTTWEVTEYPKVCPEWGIELDWYIKGAAQYNSPSLDRIDPTKGYIPGNVRIVCNSYNMAKGNCPPDKWDVLEKEIGRNILFGDNK